MVRQIDICTHTSAYARPFTSTQNMHGVDMVGAAAFNTRIPNEFRKNYIQFSLIDFTSINLACCILAWFIIRRGNQGIERVLTDITQRMGSTRTRAITHNWPYAFYFLSLGELRFFPQMSGSEESVCPRCTGHLFK